MLTILTASTRTGVMILPVQMENAWLTGQPRATSLLYNPKDAPSFFLVVEH